MNSWPGKFALRQLASLIAVGADIDRNSRRLSDQQGFIPKTVRAASAVYALNCPRRSPVAAGQHIGMETLALEQFRQANHQWRFAGPSHGEVADADHRPAQAIRRPAIKAAIPGSNQRPVKQLQWAEQQRAHGVGSRPSRAVTARPVAPD